MKTVKLILPAFAFLFAIAGALASVNVPVSVPAHVMASICTSTTLTCTENPSRPQCTSGETALYQNINGACTTILKGDLDVD
jgi:hypothetical protein